jgi:hypothetical protein
MVFLVVVLFIEFAGIDVQSASLASMVHVSVQRPWVVEAGFWLLMIYTFTVYATLYLKELRLALFADASEKNFFATLNRAEFLQKLRAAAKDERLQLGVSREAPLGRGELRVGKTIIEYDMPPNLPEAVLSVEGFVGTSARGIYVYAHKPEDHAFFQRTRQIVRPSIAHNYLVYVFPMHVAGLLLIWKAWHLIRPHLPL